MENLEYITKNKAFVIRITGFIIICIVIIMVIIRFTDPGLFFELFPFFHQQPSSSTPALNPRNGATETYVQQALDVNDFQNNYFTTLDNNNNVQVKSLKDLVETSHKSGTIVMWMFSIIPYGWELCDGGYALINNRSVQKPDFRGLMPFGSDASIPLKQTGGAAKVKLLENHLPKHLHRTGYTSSGKTNSGDAFGEMTSASTGTQFMVNTGKTGGDGEHNNMPPYLSVNFIIKVDI